MATAKEVERMTVEITLGVPKEESSIVMTVALSELWDRIAAQVADIRARGRIVDAPFESPDVDLVPPSDFVEPVE
jgi:acyl-CoA reductase-like NAD-dependent aldehyde dehydrogenase